MKFIEEIKQIQELKQEITNLKNGFLTNFFLDITKIELLIAKKTLFFKTINHTLFVFKKNDDFYNLYYFSTNDLESLKSNIQNLELIFKDLVFVVDVIDKQPKINELENMFLESGYNRYISLLRMSRIINNDSHFIEDENVKFATHQNTIEVNQLLNKYFDTFAEQLPMIQELITWIENENLIIYADANNEIIGFLIFEINGLTSYLRYWFVHPEHRDKKIGSILLKKFFNLSKKTKRQLFWVIDSNENAIKRYEHYGFHKETLFDYVMINNNKKYEI